MKQSVFLSFCALYFISFPLRAQEQEPVSDENIFFIASLYELALTEGPSPTWLKSLCKDIGGRPAGSPQDAQAADYVEGLLRELGADSIWRQEVAVPYWERGKLAKAYIVGENKEALSIEALGFSAGTSPAGVSGQIIEVQGLSELEALGAAKVKNKIIFFNRPMDATRINTFHAYGGAVDQRTYGPKKAAELGAKACLVRSMTLRQDDEPHTGVTSFGKQKPIPAAALSWQAADLLAARLKKDPNLQVHIELDCQNLPERKSYNIIGEWYGTENRDVLLVGGHLDAWDLGEGAHDDGSGVVQSLEVPYLLHKSGYKTKSSLRVVLFAAEEIGLYGARVYAKEAAKEQVKHLAAMESDAGGHLPIGFTMDAKEPRIKPAFAKVQAWRQALIPYGLYYLEPGGSAADVSQLKSLGTILFGFRPDSQRYFDYHHSRNDVFEAVNPRELRMGSASMAALIYLIDQYGFE